MTLSWPHRLLSLQEWEELPETGDARLELAEGVVVLAPLPLPWHQKACMRLGYRLDEQLPRELTSVTEVEVLVLDRPPTVRVPDVVATRTDVYATNPARLVAADVLLAVEVLSDGTRRVDRVLKPSECADAGIPQYWLVDLGSPTSLLAHVLVEGRYEVSGEHTGTAALDVAGHPVTVDLDTLTVR